MPIMIDDVINSIEVELEAAKKVYDKSGAEVKYILKAAGDNGRPNLTREEDERVQSLFSARDKAKSDIAGIERKLADAKRAKAEELEDAEKAREQHDTGAIALPLGRSRDTASLSVGRNERTYRPDTDKKGVNFLKDVARSSIFNDAGATFRLSQHMQEETVERRAQGYELRAGGTTGNFAGLVVPQYLTDMYAPLARPMRPFADICNHHDLPPEGMTVNIPLLTTGNTVQIQPTGENNAPTGGSPNDTLLTENVQTATGNVTISRQAIDRGTGIDEVVMQDLFRALASNVDSTLINQGTTGLAAIAQNSAGTFGAPPTLPLLYSKILGATSGVEAALLGLALPSHVIMYPYRWYWMAAQMGSTWPLINTMGPQYPWNAGTMDPNAGYDTGPRGTLPSGLKVIVDANIPITLGASANQDALYVVPRDECHLWEDPSAPVYIRAEQPAAASLGVLMVIYEYFAYSFRRYTNAMQSIIGPAGANGLYAPTF